MAGKSYVEYLKEAYGPERAEQMLTRPDIGYSELKKLRKLIPGDVGFNHSDILQSIKDENGKNSGR